MDKKRNYIKNFIRETMDESELERTDFEQWQFSNIEEFYKLNDHIVDKCSETMIQWLINLIKLIKKEKLHNMDKESMVNFPTSGFCCNKDKQLVIFNER